MYKRQTLTTQIVVKRPLILPTLIPNMDGKNSSVNGYISLIIATMIFLLGLLVTTTSSDQKERGTGEEKRLQQQSVAKSLNSRRKVELSRCGEMAYKLVPSCSLMNASKQLGD